ncbi:MULTISPECIES: hypothetical protein [Sandaracinus]|uniref:hypothetical protein n=1 Tax=Sandaracinus TaxID=1055688 RepID=UPI0019D4B7FB|nr:MULTISPECIES: hypothetical protein [Sandaracinus]QRN75736.1 Hypothetical protein MSR10575_88230 [Sandaracinus sp.]UJR87221.1 F5/8 type C domain-containing protein [Sandaracinus amylolyticus]
MRDRTVTLALVLCFVLGACAGPTDVPDASQPAIDAARPASDASTPDASAPTSDASAPIPDAAVADAGPSRPDADVSGLRTVEEWQALFDAASEREHARYLPLSTSANSWDYYNLAYSIDGLTAMFRATGERAYLDRALEYVENVVADAVLSSTLPDSQFRDRFLGWPAFDIPNGGEDLAGGEYALFESYCFRYAARMLRAMRDDPSVFADPAYRARYDALLAFMREHIFEKWMTRGANAHVYRSRTHMASHWAYIALELAALTDDPAQRARYRTVVDAIDRDLPNADSSLRGQMRPHPRAPGAYFWNAEWGMFGPPGQDVAHGNGVIAYLAEAHDDGREWTDDDMRALVTLLLDVLWQPSTSGAPYPEFVDGSGHGYGWFSDGFCKLGRYDVRVQRRIETHDVGRGWQLYGNAALNAHLLGVH